VPLLTDPKRKWKTAVFSAIGKKADTIRTDRYRLIAHPNGQIELYDHKTDPDENKNLATDPKHQNTVNALRAALEAGWQTARPAK